MKHTRPLKPPTPVSARSALPPSDSGSRQSSRGSAVPNLKMASSMDATTFINSARSNRSQLLASARSAQASSRSNQNSARSTASMRESRRIEDLLLTKEREIQESIALDPTVASFWLQPDQHRLPPGATRIALAALRACGRVGELKIFS